MRKLSWVAPILAAIGTHPALAHVDHGGGDGIVLPQGVTLVTVSYDFVKYKSLGDERLLDLTAQGRNAHSLTAIAVPSLSVAYGVTRDLTIGLRAPHVINREIRETGEDAAEPDVAARGGVRGFGDMSFTGTYRVIHDWRDGFDATLTLGFRAPTGAKGARDNFGELFETEHQPSSGAWDGLFGAGVAQSAGRWTFTGNVLYALAGRGSQDTTLGDRFSYGVAAAFRLWQASVGAADPMHLGGQHAHGGSAESGHHRAETGAGGATALDVSLGLDGQWQGKQEIAGVIDENIGGHVLSITPGLRLSVDRWAAFANVGIPIARDLNGIQSEPSWRLSTGVAVRF